MTKFRVRFDIVTDNCSSVFKVANLMKKYLLTNEHLLADSKVDFGSFKIEVNA